MVSLMRQTQPPPASHRRGAIILLFAVMLVLVLALVALSVDLGYVCSVKGDLQTAVDAGALAGSGVLLDGDSKAVETAERFARMNLNNQGVRNYGNQKITVELGRWNSSSRKFSSGKKPFDAVKVTGRAEDASLFFGRAFGANRFASQASAVATYQPRDIMLVLDVSGSMNESRLGIRKMDELRSAAKQFFSYLREARARDRVGFSYYSTKAGMGANLSFDLDSVENAMMAKLRPGGWTNIYDGMRLAREEINQNARSNAATLMVVLTDGAANMNQPGDWYDPGEAKRRVIQEAEAAQQQKIPVFTMALDSLTTEVDVALMARVAEITSSESYHVIAGEPDTNGNTQLREAFRRVAIYRPLRIVE